MFGDITKQALKNLSGKYALSRSIEGETSVGQDRGKKTNWLELDFFDLLQKNADVVAAVDGLAGGLLQGGMLDVSQISVPNKYVLWACPAKARR